MKFKKFLVLFISILFFLLHISNSFANSIVLTYANFPPAPTFPCIQMERWTKELEKRSKGVVKVKTFPGSTLLGAKNMLDGVISGIADIGCMVFAYQPGRFPLLEGMDLPIGFPNSTVANAVLFKLFQKYRPKSLKKVKVIALFTAPGADIMSEKPIKCLKDLKGYELRCTGAGVPVLKLLGATPVAMPQSETPEALQKGVVKGVFSTMDILKDMNIAEFCHYGTVCHMQTTSFAVVMNIDTWNRLPQNIKNIINDLAWEHSIWTGKYEDKHITESIKWAQTHYNFKLIKLSPDQYKLWHKRVHILIEHWIEKTEKKGLPARQFISDLYKLKAKYEKIYLNSTS